MMYSIVYKYESHPFPGSFFHVFSPFSKRQLKRFIEPMLSAGHRVEVRRPLFSEEKYHGGIENHGKTMGKPWENHEISLVIPSGNLT